MKKIMSILLAAAMMLAMFAGCGSSEGSAAPAASEPEAAASGEAAAPEAAGTEKIALVTDVGNIDDESFNQTCYEAMVAFGKDKGIETQGGDVPENLRIGSDLCTQKEDQQEDARRGNSFGHLHCPRRDAGKSKKIADSY